MGWQFGVVFCGTIVDVGVDRMLDAHDKTEADATLLLHPNDHPFDSDLVEVNSESFVTAFHNRPHAENVWRQNLVNAGLYVLEKSAIEPFKNSAKEIFDFGKDLFPQMLRDGKKLFGYNSPEFIKD